MTKNKIVLVSFPFDDFSSAKLRPAICLTNPIGAHSHVVLAFITSKVPDHLLKTNIVLNSEQEDFTETGLRVSSTIRLHRLMTITTSIIQRELGTLPFRVDIEVKAKLMELFNLT